MSKNLLIKRIETILFEEQLSGELRIQKAANRIYCALMGFPEAEEFKKAKNNEKTDFICAGNTTVYQLPYNSQD